MATTFAADGIDAPPVPVATRDRGRLFVVYAWTCLAVAFGGFVPSFWYPLATTGFAGSWLVIVHGLMFSSWTVLFVTQTLLVERDRVIDHRAWGVAGVSLASMLFLIGIATAVGSLETRLADGFGDRARAFTIVPMSNVVLFFGLFAAAVANVRRPDWHKRLMMTATGIALVPAFARIFFVLMDGRAIGATGATSAPSTPLIALRPSAAVLVLLLGGSLHPAWLWGMTIFVAVCLARVPVSQTAGWHAVADWLVAFG